MSSGANINNLRNIRTGPVVRNSSSMRKTLRSTLLFLGAAATCGTCLALLDLLVHRGYSSHLSFYQAVRPGASWSDVRGTLQHFPQDCSAPAASAVPPTRISCSDYWWIYTFYVDVHTQRITAKRFYITDLRPLPFRLIRNFE
jgi:hypothetical protein